MKSGWLLVMVILAGCSDAAPHSSFDTALPIALGDTVSSALSDVTTPAYYAIELDAQRRILVSTATASLTYSDVLDTAITIYSPDREPLAANDDAWPRTQNTDSVLTFEAREAGTYFISVGDCLSQPVPTGCAPADKIHDLSYSLFPDDERPLDLVGDAQQDGTIAHAESAPAGVFQLDGNFRTPTDTHVFELPSIASPTLAAGERAHLDLWVQPTGVDGNGSTADAKVWIEDAAGNVIAAADERDHGKDTQGANTALVLTPVVTAGATYYEFVQNTAATSSPTDYYFTEHLIEGRKPVEHEGATASGANDTPATAEPLAVTTETAGRVADFEGDLGTPTDVDVFAIPFAGTKLSLFCESARFGSGLVGLTATVLGADQTTPLASLGPETTTADLQLLATPIPSGNATLYLQIAATARDPNNTGTFYECRAADLD